MNNWISVKDKLPETIEGKDYTENVWVLCDGEVMIMRLVFTQDDNNEWSWFWANCYGDVFADGEIDDDYNVTHWMPLEIPKSKQ